MQKVGDIVGAKVAPAEGWRAKDDEWTAINYGDRGRHFWWRVNPARAFPAFARNTRPFWAYAVVESSPDCTVTVDNQSHILTPGEVWLFDCRTIYGVVNNGDTAHTALVLTYDTAEEREALYQADLLAQNLRMPGA